MVDHIERTFDSKSIKAYIEEYFHESILPSLMGLTRNKKQNLFILFRFRPNSQSFKAI